MALGVAKAQYNGPNGRVSPREIVAASPWKDLPSPPLPPGVLEWQTAEDDLAGAARKQPA